MIGFQVPPINEKISAPHEKEIVKLLTVVMADKRSQILAPGQRSVARVGHDVDDRNSVQPDHLLKVNVSSFISVDIIHGKTKIGPIRVGLENISPVGVGGL